MAQPNKTMTRRALSIGFAAALAVLAVGCGPSAPSTSTPAPHEVVRVNIVTWPGYGPIYLAQAKGFFRDEGIDVDVAIQENTQARNAALVSGQVDLIGITFDSIVLYNLQGLPMQVVGISDISNGGDGIIARRGINTIQQLAGHTIAFPEGQPSHMFLLYELDHAGVNPSDVHPVLTDDAGKAGELFAAGRVDAAVTWEPWLSRAQESAGGHVIVNSHGIQNLLIGILAANRNRVAASTPKLKAFFRAWYRALDYYQAHPQESEEIMARGFGMPTQEFTDILGGLRFIPRAEAAERLGVGGRTATFTAIARDNARLWRRGGVAQTDQVNPADVFTAAAQP